MENILNLIVISHLATSQCGGQVYMVGVCIWVYEYVGVCRCMYMVGVCNMYWQVLRCKENPEVF